MVFFSNLPAKVSDDKLTSIVDNFRQTGDCDLADYLISYHISLALAIAKKFGRNDELVSAGLLSLVKAVHRIPTDMYDNEIAPYLSARISYGIRSFLRRQPLIRIPRGKSLKNQQPFKINLLTPLTGRPGKHELQLQIREVLAKIAVSSHEKIIAKCMLKDGYKLKEMAEMCGVSTQRISQIRMELIERFITRWSE